MRERSRNQRNFGSTAIGLGLAAAIVVGALGCGSAPTPAPLAKPPDAHAHADLRGKTISTFVVFRAMEALKGMADGEVLALTTTEHPGVVGDVRVWARQRGLRIVREVEGEGLRQFYVEKAPFEPSGKHLALIISDDGLEELLSPLGFALAGALAGHEVSLYFQGPGVHVLERGFVPRLSGISKPFSAFARKGMSEVGHVTPQEKLAQLRSLGARIYACTPSHEVFGVAIEDLIYDDIVLSEYITFMEVLERADIQLYPM